MEQTIFQLDPIEATLKRLEQSLQSFGVSQNMAVDIMTLCGEVRRLQAENEQLKKESSFD
jgi:hypothetical protein